MSRIGKVVLFAGLIMSAVFLAFVTQPDVIAKMFGVGLGLAILIDVVPALEVAGRASEQLLRLVVAVGGGQPFRKAARPRRST